MPILDLVCWRIGVDTPNYEADDLSGKGAEITGGRWNRKGTPVVYTSATISLAYLETLVHLGKKGLPLNRFLARILVPQDLIEAAYDVRNPVALPVGWTAEPAGRASIEFGQSWLQSNASAVMIVPSLIVPEEQNYLINPNHPEAIRITATKVRAVIYDARLRP